MQNDPTETKTDNSRLILAAQDNNIQEFKLLLQDTVKIDKDLAMTLIRLGRIDMLKHLLSDKRFTYKEISAGMNLADYANEIGQSGIAYYLLDNYSSDTYVERKLNKKVIPPLPHEMEEIKQKESNPDLDYLLQSAKDGDIDAIYKIYDYKDKIGKDKFLKLARDLDELLPECNNSNIIYLRAYMHDIGLGGPINEEEAIKLYKKSLEYNNPAPAHYCPGKDIIEPVQVCYLTIYRGFYEFLT